MVVWNNSVGNSSLEELQCPRQDRKFKSPIKPKVELIIYIFLDFKSTLKMMYVS